MYSWFQSIPGTAKNTKFYLIVICIISSKVNYDNILTSIVTSFSHKLLPFSFSIFTYFCIASSLVYKRKIRHISRHDYALYDTSTFCFIKEKAKDELCFFLSSYTSSQYQIFKVMGFFSKYCFCSLSWTICERSQPNSSMHR